MIYHGISINYNKNKCSTDITNNLGMLPYTFGYSVVLEEKIVLAKISYAYFLFFYTWF